MFQQGLKQNTNQQDTDKSALIPSKKTSLSLDDLTELDAKNLIKNYKNFSGGGSPISHYVRDYIKHKEPNISPIEIESRIETSTSKDLMKILDESSKDKTYKRSESVLELIKGLNSALNAPDKFKYLQIIKELTGKESLSEFLIISALNEDDKERLTHVLSSPDFKKFKSDITQKLGIEISNDLILLEKIYQDHLKGTSILNPAVTKALEEVKKVFPEIKMDTLSGLTAINYYVNKTDKDGKPEFDLDKFKEKLNYARTDYDFVTKTFEVKFKSLEHVLDMHELNKKGIEIISDYRAKELYDYLKENYPSLKLGNEQSYMFLGWTDGFARRYAEPFVKELNVEPKTIDEFLKIFGKNLSDLNFDRGGMYQLARGINTPIDELVNDSNFHKFVSAQIDKYPDLKKIMDIETIAGLTRAYENRFEYHELQNAIEKFGKTNLPKLKLNDSAQVSKLLNTVKDLDFEKVVLGEIDSNHWGFTFDREDTFRNINSPKAKELYDVLTNKWGVDRITLDEFNYLLADSNALSFFKSDEMQVKFKSLDESYNLGIYLENKPSEILRVFENREFFEKNYEILSDPKVVEYFKLYNPARFKSQDNPSFKGNALDLIYFSNLDKLKNIEDILLCSANLQKEYGLPLENIPEHVFYSSEKIKSDELKESYKWAKDFYFKDVKSVDKQDLFNAADIAYKQNDLDKTIFAIDNMGIERSSSNLAFIVKFLHDNESVRTTVLDSDFQKFSNVLDDRFYSGKKDVSRILEYVELFNEAKDKPERLKAVLSNEFQNVTKTIGQMFHVATERPSTLLPMMKAAENFDKSALEGLFGILKLKGEKIHSNDAMFLVEIAKDKNLRSQLENRAGMLAELSEVYKSKSYPRSEIDQLSELPEPSEISEESFKNTRIKEREEVINNYTERPNLEEFSNLQLLRLTLINRALQSEEFQKKLGQIAKADISDKTTERGGNIQLEGGKLSLAETVSMANHDGAFVNQKYGHLIDGIGTFHLHALEVDESKYSGPSGWLGSGAADIGYVDRFNSVDTVFTAMGHPVDSEGKAITSLLRMNADTYFIDKRDAKNPKLRIVDFGEIIVPYNQ